MPNFKPIKPDIIPSSGKRILSDVVAAPKKEIETQIFRTPPPTMKRPAGRFKNRFFNWKLYAVAIILVSIWVFYGFVFAKMRVVIQPKFISAALNQTISLSKNPSQNEILYGSIAVASTQNGTFDSKEKKSVDKKAKGVVVIFNTSSKNPQVLVASTRLQSPDGKIYKIPKTVIIPGYMVENTKIVSGSKEVEIVADTVGAESNIGLVDFTIPGFKGSPKFHTIFARSKTEMKGGASGVETVVGQKDVADALHLLVAEAKKNSLNNILKKLPNDAFLIVSSLEYAVSNEKINPLEGEVAQKFDVLLSGESRAATVSKKDVAALLSKKISTPNNFQMIIKNLGELSFEPMNYKFNIPNFNLKVKGVANFQASIDAESLKTKLIDAGLKDSASILNAFPEIGRVEVHFSPFWLHKIPTDPSRIDIILK